MSWSVVIGVRPAWELCQLEPVAVTLPWQRTPGHQFVEPSDLVIGDAAEHVGQPGLRIDAIQLGGFDQGIDNCR